MKNKQNNKHNPYKNLFNPSKLRPIKIVNKILSKELSRKKKKQDKILIGYLRHEKRLIYLDWFWNNKIDFETFSKLIKEEIIILDL